MTSHTVRKRETFCLLFVPCDTCAINVSPPYDFQATSEYSRGSITPCELFYIVVTGGWCFGFEAANEIYKLSRVLFSSW